MKFLVTGGAGFIGSHLTDALVERGDVIVIDNLSSGKKENVNLRARFYERDLGDFEKVREIFEKEKPDVVFHLAAQINVRESVENPINDAEENIFNSLNLIDLCVEFNVKKFIFSSTGGAIYGDLNFAGNESLRENPVSPYGCAKLAIEKYLNFYNKTHELDYVCLRYANVYGPRQNSKGEAGVISIFFDNMFSGKDCVIFGGIQTRDFVFVEDIVKANVIAIEKGSGVYNVGTGKETDIIGLFNMVNKYFDERFKAIFEEGKRGEQMRSFLDCKRLKDLGWEAKVGLEEGLDRCFCWWLKQ